MDGRELLSPPEADGRPLYLLAEAPLGVAVDGPALRVDDPTRAAGRYPLRRVSRVMAGESVAWGSGSLALCLGAGIPVSILNGEGELVGLCLPTRVPSTPFSALLGELAELRCWAEAHANWQLAGERRAVLAALRLARVGVADLRPNPVRARLYGLVATAFGSSGRRALAVWRGSAALLAVEICRGLGIGPHLSASGGPRNGKATPLAVELGEMLAWLPLGWLAGLAVAGGPLPAGPRALAERFEHEQKTLAGFALDLVGLLQGLAIDASRRFGAGRHPERTWH